VSLFLIPWYRTRIAASLVAIDVIYLLLIFWLDSRDHF
jgi:hypothetical protein